MYTWGKKHTQVYGETAELYDLMYWSFSNTTKYLKILILPMQLELKTTYFLISHILLVSIINVT